MKQKQPHLLVIWGKYESSFDPSETESYRRDVPSAQVHIVDGGQFRLGHRRRPHCRARAYVFSARAVGTPLA